jgi:hypothetical protein
MHAGVKLRNSFLSNELWIYVFLKQRITGSINYRSWESLTGLIPLKLSQNVPFFLV